jgi:hypothetical protein
MPFTASDDPFPSGLRTDEFALRPIQEADAERDHAAVMESREDLRLWEQSSWPEDDFTVEANRLDLVNLERRHAEGRALTYAVVDPDGDHSLGCVYIFPTDATFLAKSAVTAVASDRWADVEAVIYFWVRSSRIASGLDRRLLAALRDWFAGEWALQRTVYVTNEQFAQQADLLSSAGMTVRFELREPDKAGTYLVFA